jgi:hypothetical protein
MFGSKTLTEHFARGVIGMGAFAAAVFWTPHQPWLALAALPIGFVALRGCPTCWLLGLAQTVAPRSTRVEACVNSGCAERGSSGGPHRACSTCW